MSSRFESLTGVVDAPFPEYDTPPDEPMGLARRWIDAAVEAGVREPMAMSLATADTAGRASNRTVAVIDALADGLLFTSHSTSRKGRDIAATGWAAGLFYWRETGRQLMVSGPVDVLDGADADRLWNARAVPLHAMSAASRQSEPLADAAALREEAGRLAEGGAPLPRPERFVGYRLRPAAVEFWCAADDRLHRRLRYDHTASGWRTSRLQP